MNAQPEMIQIELDALVTSPRNARKTGGHDVAGLAASIRAHGLLQNLTVMRGEVPGHYEVIAGGRRLAALQLLATQGVIAANEPITCRLLTNDEIALEASTAENTLREAMHPADQFDAFRAMVEAKKDVPEIAAHFGVTPLVVQQRLKLANVSPKLVQQYRDGAMKLDQLQALAITDDHDAQERAWATPNSWERDASSLRNALTKKEVRSDSTVARFVGVEAFEAAGGKVRRDLFASVDYLSDRTLLNKLAQAKLDAIAQQELAAGWSWAQAFVSLDYSQVSEYPRHSEPKRSAITREGEQRIEAIGARLAELEAQFDHDAGEWRDESIDAATGIALHEEWEALEAERDELQHGGEVWTASAKAEAGVLVYLGNGGVEIARGRLKPGQRVDAGTGAVAGKAKPSTAEQKAEGKPKKPELSDNMVRRLSMHRTLALQEELARRPDVALQLLVTHLVLQTIGQDRWATSNLLGIKPDSALNQVEMAVRGDGWNDLSTAPAMVALQERLKALKAKAKGTSYVSVSEMVAKASQAEQLQLLALCTALTLDAIQVGGNQRNDQANALATLLGVDMAKWWQPTAENYLGVVPKSLLAEAAAECHGKAAGEAVAEMKKDEAIAATAKHLAGTNWLPKPLRGPGYTLRRVGSTCADAQKKGGKASTAAKAPAKPAAKSAAAKGKAKPAKAPAKAVAKPAAKPKAKPATKAKPAASKAGKAKAKPAK